METFFCFDFYNEIGKGLSGWEQKWRETGRYKEKTVIRIYLFLIKGRHIQVVNSLPNRKDPYPIVIYDLVAKIFKNGLKTQMCLLTVDPFSE